MYVEITDKRSYFKGWVGKVRNPEDYYTGMPVLVDFAPIRNSVSYFYPHEIIEIPDEIYFDRIKQLQVIH